MMKVSGGDDFTIWAFDLVLGQSSIEVSISSGMFCTRCADKQKYRSNEYAEFDGFAVHVEHQNQLPSFPELPLSICPTRLSFGMIDGQDLDFLEHFGTVNCDA